MSEKLLSSQDLRYIYQLVAKWQPLTEGMGGRHRFLLSWVLEREAKFLRGQRDEDADGQVISRWMKYFFPALRRVTPQITVLDHLAFGDDETAMVNHVDSLIRYELGRIFEADVSGTSRHQPQELEDDPETNQIIQELAERLVESLRLFEPFDG